MSVFDFFENHGENRIQIAGTFSYELECVASAYSNLLKARHDHDFTEKTGQARLASAARTFDPRVDRACDALRAAVARMTRAHPALAALCYRELLADDGAEYQALLERATTAYGLRAITDTRRALARAAHLVANERERS